MDKDLNGNAQRARALRHLHGDLAAIVLVVARSAPTRDQFWRYGSSTSVTARSTAYKKPDEHTIIPQLA